MTVTCPYCNLNKDLGDVRIPHAGTLATCPRCGTQFEIKPERPESWLMRWRRFLLTLGIVLCAAALLLAHDWKLDKNYFLQPGTWQGEIAYLEKKYPFELVIEKAQDGKMEGYMDWFGNNPHYILGVRGTYMGNHLLFEEYEFINGGSKYGFNDKKDVYIVGNEMTGTDKNGTAMFHAVKRP